MARGSTASLRAAARAGVLVVGAACAPAPPHLAGPAPAGSTSARAPSPSASPSTTPAAFALAPLELAPLDEGGSWPPAPIAPPLDASEPGEGEWTVKAGKELGVDVRVIEDALKVRQESSDKKNQEKYSNKIVALLRKQFGGHGIQKK